MPRPALLAVALALAPALAACSSAESSVPDASTIDSAPPIDAAPPTVMKVTCPATPAGAIMAVDGTEAYMPPMVTINVGQVVEFTMPGGHNVVPDASSSDPGLNVTYNEVKCLMFTRAGRFGFHCGPHIFYGAVVVQ